MYVIIVISYEQLLTDNRYGASAETGQPVLEVKSPDRRMMLEVACSVPCGTISSGTHPLKISLVRKTYSFGTGRKILPC